MISPGKIVLLVGVVLALVWQHVEATRIGYRVEKSRREIIGLRATNSSMRRKLESHEAPAQLAHQAQTKLGMVPAKPESMKILGALQNVPPNKDWADGFSRIWRTYSRKLPLLASKIGPGLRPHP